jgi:2-haloacid dehalogenase
MSDFWVDIVVFDIGNVLLDWDPDYLYAQVIPDQKARAWFLSQVCTQDWNREQDRGRRFADAIAERRTLFPEWREEIEAYHHRWTETVSRAIEGSVSILARLREQCVPCYAITNFSSEKFAESQERFPFLKTFDGIVVSGDEGTLKPRRAIYEKLCERYGLAPDRCVFIDDVEANVEGARAVGMAGIRFEDPAQLARDLRALGFDV